MRILRIGEDKGHFFSFSYCTISLVLRKPLELARGNNSAFYNGCLQHFCVVCVFPLRHSGEGFYSFCSFCDFYKIGQYGAVILGLSN